MGGWCYSIVGGLGWYGSIVESVRYGLLKIVICSREGEGWYSRERLWSGLVWSGWLVYGIVERGKVGIVDTGEVGIVETGEG